MEESSDMEKKLSPRTVDAHRVHIREKLGLSNGTELTRYAVRWTETGMIEYPPGGPGPGPGDGRFQVNPVRGHCVIANEAVGQTRIHRRGGSR